MRSSFSPILRRLPSLLALLTILFLAAVPAWGQTAPAASSVSTEELEGLVKTLEDPAARDVLVKQLRGLIEAQRQTEQPDTYVGSGLLDQIAREIKRTSEQLFAAASAVSEAPRLIAWFEQQMSSPERRAVWREVIVLLVLLVALGWAAEWATQKILARPRAGLEGRVGESWGLRLLLLSLRTVLDLMPVAVFAVVTYVLLPIMQPQDMIRRVVIEVLTAYVLVRAIMEAARMLFAPAAPNLRIVPLTDETANYLFIWTRRFTAISVIGYFVISAAHLLGLPVNGQALAMKLLGLVVAAMVVIFLLQNRKPVADFIRGNGKTLPGLQVLRNRLADVWHILAVIYVAMSCMVWMFGVAGGFEYVFRSTVLSIVVLTAGALLATGLGRGVSKAFDITDEVKARFPGLELRANRYVPALHVFLKIAIWVITGMAVLQAWGVDVFGWLGGPFGRRILSSSFSIALVLFLALVIWETVSSGIERYLNRTGVDGRVIERGTRARTLLPLLRNVLMIVLTVMVLLIVLSELGVNIAPLLAGAGVIGLAIGFGSQKLVQDVITGAFILFEDSLSVGDNVKLAGESGVVEAVTIRSIRLRDGSGNIHSIPFSSVTTVTNMTKGYANHTVDIGVGYSADIDKAMEVMREIGVELDQDPKFGGDVLRPVEVLGVEELAESAVIVKIQFRTRPNAQQKVAREFNRRLKLRFDALGIELPFPQRTLHFANAPGPLPAQAARRADRDQKTMPLIHPDEK
jgi:small-conductance mechanosensitive channel